MAYTSQAQIESYIAPPDLIAALDDGTSAGSLNTTVLENIIENVSTDIDGALANIYNVPFSNPIPPKVARAALVFACEAIYQRRLAPNEKNPYTGQAKLLREELDKISTGEMSLDLTVARGYEPGVLASSDVSMDMTSA